jgi:hypothetical protein
VPGAGVVVPALDGDALYSVEDDEVAVVDELWLTDCPIGAAPATGVPVDT